MDRSLPWWLRIAFFFIALQAFEFILTLFRPDLILSLEPWTATPLNARFIASLYLATGIGVLLCGLGRNFLQIRIVLIGTGVATGVIFILSLYRLYFLSWGRSWQYGFSGSVQFTGRTWRYL